MTERKRRLTFDAPRELLLTEIARRCRACDAPARLGLTKAEARAYVGFECEPCGEWNDDELAERDVPEWWEELRVTGLDALRASRAEGSAGVEVVRDEDGSDSVNRLSEAWRASHRDEGLTGVGARDADSSEDSL